jgi:hypothetical protein
VGKKICSEMTGNKNSLNLISYKHNFDLLLSFPNILILPLEWLTQVHCVQEVPGSNPGPETSYPD